MNKKIIGALLLGAVVGIAANAFAEDKAEVILRALINAGVITQEDIAAAAKEVAAEQKTKEAAMPAGIEDRVAALEKKVPSWVEKIDMAGDIRIRYEAIDKEHRADDDKRARFRLRWGVKTKANDKTDLAFGFASGSSDSPTSTNQTLEKEFQRKPVWIDYAYAKYSPYENLSLTGGKFPSPFYHTDMLFSSDITMDGFAVNAYRKFFEGGSLPEVKLFGTGAYLPIDDNTDISDVYLTAVQAGLETKLAAQTKVKTAVAFYNFHGLEGYPVSALEEDVGTNTIQAGGIANDFQVISPILNVGWDKPLGLNLPLAFFGEYAENVAVPSDEENKAWRTGLQLGKGGSNKGDWKFIGQYTRLERDAFYDAFPDVHLNSANNGGTNMKGWRLTTDYALAKNVNFGINYYYTQPSSGDEDNVQKWLFDWLFKF